MSAMAVDDDNVDDTDNTNITSKTEILGPLYEHNSIILKIRRNGNTDTDIIQSNTSCF